MKLEIYQIGKVPPLTVVECDDCQLVNDDIPRIRINKGGMVVAMFFTNNIAGFKVINEDDEIKEATTEAIKEFSKAVIDGIDEGYISHSSDMIDFTQNYLNSKGCVENG